MFVTSNNSKKKKKKKKKKKSKCMNENDIRPRLTLCRINLKTQLYCYGYGFRPH